MKPHFLLTLTLIVVLLAPGLAAGQTGSATNTTVEPAIVEELEEPDVCEAPEAIDQNTVLCSASLDGDTATLVLRSDRLQSVTVTDAGGVFAGGEVQRTSHQLRPDEPNTVRISVTRHRNMAGVTVDTGSTLYGVPFDDTSTLIGPPWSAGDVQLGALAAAISTALCSGVVVLRSVYGRTEEPERVA
jgi:hypothetical protein